MMQSSLDISNTKTIEQGNWIITEPVEVDKTDVHVTNLVIFPGVVAKFAHCNIDVDKNVVVLGDFQLDHCNLKSYRQAVGYKGSFEELQRMVGLTADQVSELLRRIKN